MSIKQFKIADLSTHSDFLRALSWKKNDNLLFYRNFRFQIAA